MSSFTKKRINKNPDTQGREWLTISDGFHSAVARCSKELLETFEKEYEPISKESMPLVTLRRFKPDFGSNTSNENDSAPSKCPVVVIEAMTMVTAADTPFSVSGQRLARLQDVLDEQSRSNSLNIGLNQSLSTASKSCLVIPGNPLKKLPVPTPLPQGLVKPAKSLADTWASKPTYCKLTDKYCIISDADEFLLDNIGFGNPPSEEIIRPDPKRVFPKLGDDRPKPTSTPRGPVLPKAPTIAETSPLNIHRDMDEGKSSDSDGSENSEEAVAGWEATDDEESKEIEGVDTSDAEIEVERVTSSAPGAGFTRGSLGQEENKLQHDGEDELQQSDDVEHADGAHSKLKVDGFKEASGEGDDNVVNSARSLALNAQLSEVEMGNAEDQSADLMSRAPSRSPKVLVPASDTSQSRSQNNLVVNSQDLSEGTLPSATQNDSPKDFNHRSAHQMLESLLSSAPKSDQSRSVPRPSACVSNIDTEDEMEVELLGVKDDIDFGRKRSRPTSDLIGSERYATQGIANSRPENSTLSSFPSHSLSSKAREKRSVGLRARLHDHIATQLSPQKGSFRPSRHSSKLSSESFSSKSESESSSAEPAVEYNKVPRPTDQITGLATEDVTAEEPTPDRRDRKTVIKSTSEITPARFATQVKRERQDTFPHNTPSPPIRRKRSSAPDTPDITENSVQPALGEPGPSSLRAVKIPRLASYSSSAAQDQSRSAHRLTQSRSLTSTTSPQTSSPAPSTPDLRHSDSPILASSASKRARKPSSRKSQISMVHPKWARPLPLSSPALTRSRDGLPSHIQPSSTTSPALVAVVHDPRPWKAPSFQVKQEYMSQRLESNVLPKGALICLLVISTIKFNALVGFTARPDAEEPQSLGPVPTTSPTSMAPNSEKGYALDLTHSKEEHASQFLLEPLEEENSQPNPEAILGGFFKPRLTVPANIPGHARLYTYANIHALLQEIQAEEESLKNAGAT
ncbi:hypothetical protein FRB98_009647 [Tulasnella sp. 332]|nr:hypothetical protein FRB98_009647 [Tulasnella sp. 332]